MAATTWSNNCLWSQFMDWTQRSAVSFSLSASKFISSVTNGSRADAISVTGSGRWNSSSWRPKDSRRIFISSNAWLKRFLDQVEHLKCLTLGENHRLDDLWNLPTVEMDRSVWDKRKGTTVGSNIGLKFFFVITLTSEPLLKRSWRISINWTEYHLSVLTACWKCSRLTSAMSNMFLLPMFGEAVLLAFIVQLTNIMQCEVHFIQRLHYAAITFGWANSSCRGHPTCSWLRHFSEIEYRQLFDSAWRIIG